MKHILVLGVQVPFVYGGAEILTKSLVIEINKIDGLKAELVQLPFKWYPEEQILNDILAWRVLDLSEANGVKIDLVISTKFPSYAIRHHNKSLWLVHQYREMYDLQDTIYYKESISQKKVRKKLKELDNKFFLEYKEIYTISNNISKRLKKYNGFNSTPLLPPPALKDKIIFKEYGDYILYIGRLDPLKRVDLLIKALSKSSNAKAIIIGKGEEESYLKGLIEKYSLYNRCLLLGFVSDSELIEKLSFCRAVFYAPIDEDYGYVTIEAFLAKKAVITCKDSGEVKNMVAKTGSGFICENCIDSIALSIKKVYNMSNLELEKLTQNGYAFAKKIRWERVIKKLVLDKL